MPGKVARMSSTGPFVDYLTKSLGLAPHEVPKQSQWASISNTLGAMALRLNMLTADQVDRILEVQEEGSKRYRFGEMAVQEGLLTPDQVHVLLELQHANKRLELGEQLVVAGKLDVPALFRCLADFTSAERAGTLGR